MQKVEYFFGIGKQLKVIEQFKYYISLIFKKAHDNVCIGVEWHPIEPSKVVTCGWDGVLKLWD